MAKLKPCPFCGGIAKVKTMTDQWHVKCGNRSCLLYVSTFLQPTQCEAVRVWNTRKGGGE